MASEPCDARAASPGIAECCRVIRVGIEYVAIAVDLRARRDAGDARGAVEYFEMILGAPRNECIALSLRALQHAVGSFDPQSTARHCLQPDHHRRSQVYKCAGAVRFRY